MQDKHVLKIFEQQKNIYHVNAAIFEKFVTLTYNSQASK